MDFSGYSKPTHRGTVLVKSEDGKNIKNLQTRTGLEGKGK